MNKVRASAKNGSAGAAEAANGQTLGGTVSVDVPKSSGTTCWEPKGADVLKARGRMDWSHGDSGLWRRKAVGSETGSRAQPKSGVLS